MTARRPASRGYSGADWAVRVGLALLLALLGVMAGRQALATAVRSADPQRAYRLAPRDGQVLANMAEVLAGPDAGVSDRREADRLAMRALRADATALPAVVTLGLQTQLRGDVPRGRNILNYAQTLSRRDLRTQLWAIEDAVARDEVAEALQHYDIALRTSKQAPDLLFPILGVAIGEANVRRALAQIMKARPRWNELFIPYVAGNGKDPVAVIALFNQLSSGSVLIPPASQGIVIARLIRDHPGLAWAYYASIHRDAQRWRSRDPLFTAEITEPTLFDWVPTEDTSMTVAIQSAPTGGSVDFTAPTGTGGVLLSQLQYLPPGNYRLSGRSAEIEQSAAAQPYWQLVCEGGRELGRVGVGNSDRNGGRFTGQFVVPEGCAIQRLALLARPSDSPTGLTGRLTEVRLVRTTGESG